MRLRASIAVGVATIVVAAPAFAQLPDPTKDLPKVPVPKIPVPTVQVPVPTVPVPVPTVQAPVPVPTVQVPVPTAVPPSSGGGSGGSAPAATPAPASGGSSTGGGGSAPSSGGSSGGGSSSSSSGSAPSSSSAGRNSSGGGETSSRRSGKDGESASRRDTPAAPRTRAPRVETGPAKRERQLRATVARAGSCLGRLSSGQRRVLTLRAGIGKRPPRSRANVARRLDVTVRRVARLETTGLRRLRTLSSGGACAAPAAATTLSSGDAAANAGREAIALPRGASSRGGASGSEAAAERKPRERDRGSTDACDGPADSCDGGSRGGVEAATMTNPPVAGQAGSINLLVPLLVLMMAGAAFVVTRAVRRAPEPAPVAPPPEDEPREPWTPAYRSTMDGPRWDGPRPGVDD